MGAAAATGEVPRAEAAKRTGADRAKIASIGSSSVGEERQRPELLELSGSVSITAETAENYGATWRLATWPHRATRPRPVLRRVISSPRGRRLPSARAPAAANVDRQGARVGVEGDYQVPYG